MGFANTNIIPMEQTTMLVMFCSTGRKMSHFKKALNFSPTQTKVVPHDKCNEGGIC